MMLLTVVTVGTLTGRTALRAGDEGLVLARELLEPLGVHDGDEVEIHTDGRVIVLLPAPAGREQQDDAEDVSTPSSRPCRRSR